MSNPTPYADWLKYHETNIAPMRDAPDWDNQSDSEYDDAYNVHLEGLHALIIGEQNLLDAASDLFDFATHFEATFGPHRDSDEPRNGGDCVDLVMNMIDDCRALIARAKPSE